MLLGLTIFLMTSFISKSECDDCNLLSIFQLQKIKKTSPLDREDEILALGYTSKSVQKVNDGTTILKYSKCKKEFGTTEMVGVVNSDYVIYYTENLNHYLKIKNYIKTLSCERERVSNGDYDIDVYSSCSDSHMYGFTINEFGYSISIIE